MTDNSKKIEDNILNIACEILKSLFESIEKFLNEIKLKNIISCVLNLIFLFFFVINGIIYIIGKIIYHTGMLFLFLSSIITENLNFDKQIKNLTSSDIIEKTTTQIEEYMQPFINDCKNKYNKSIILAKNLNQSDKAD